MNDHDLTCRPLLLEPARVRRTYRGGSWLDRRHGIESAGESDRPEEWLASMTEAVNPGFPPVENEGLSATISDGQTLILRDLVQQEPERMLGKTHAERYGAVPGVLAKVIDSAERLSIQVHPDKLFAKEYFHSDYGKTECWHILETRKIDGQSPFLLMGFRPGVTREMWEDVYRRQDIPAMVGCLNRVTPKAGETWLIRGGMPHAIGPGCILVEIQEPTDYTMRSERTKADASPIPDALIHQGLGEKALMECFHYETMNETDLRRNCFISPETVEYPDGSKWQPLIGRRDTDCFSMERLEVCHSLRYTDIHVFSIVLVLNGEGTLEYPGGIVPVREMQQFFLPAGMESFTFRSKGSEPLTVIRCNPPGAETMRPGS